MLTLDINTLAKITALWLHQLLHICTEEEEDEEEEDKPKTKTVKETVWDWALLNDNKALWLRSPSDVSDEEYLNFYKALAKVGLCICAVQKD